MSVPTWSSRSCPTRAAQFLQKVRHSAFYATALAYLLRQLETERLILTGQVTEQCILYTALDAYVRHFPVIVPPDAVAHIDADLGEAALRMMEQTCGPRSWPRRSAWTDVGTRSCVGLQFARRHRAVGDFPSVAHGEATTRRPLEES